MCEKIRPGLALLWGGSVQTYLSTDAASEQKVGNDILRSHDFCTNAHTCFMPRLDLTHAAACRISSSSRQNDGRTNSIGHRHRLRPDLAPTTQRQASPENQNCKVGPPLPVLALLLYEFIRTMDSPHKLPYTIGHDHTLALLMGMFVPNARTLSHPHHGLLDALTLCTLCAVGC